MRYFVTIGDREIEVDLTGETPRVDGTPVDAELAAVPGGPVRHLLANGRSHAFIATQGERRGRWEIQLGAGRLKVDAVDERTRTIRAMTGDSGAEAEKVVTAPMPGLVLRVEVAVGDTVRAGQGVVVVEAMKMENELKAPADGVVARVEVEAGRTVEKGSVLLVLE